MNKSEDSKLLQQYFDHFGLGEIFDSEVLNSMNLLLVDKGECICMSGYNIESMYFLVSGKLKVYTVQKNGKALLLRFNKPLSIIGDVEFITGYKIMCNVESLSKSIVIEAKYADLFNHSYDDARFLRFLIKHLCHKLYTISNSTALNLLYTVENRFASYLLSTICYENTSEYTDEIRSSKLTEIATLLGTSYRHLNRVIGQLASQNIIARKRGAIVILDIEKLKELSCNNLYE